ncbi:MAG TPA: EAL domain-containing protein [Kofleriaceae bacterium]|nr:EAL domain-containing protein [Kofleriaceae bacterium]
MHKPLSDAVSRGDIYIAYQPIVDLTTGGTFGYEALARSAVPAWRGPLELIAAAVDTHCMGELGRALRQMAIAGCQTHPLFINLHPSEFDAEWLVRPDDAITTHPHDIYLEITESVPISHYRFCRSVLTEIRGKGIKLAVDDLGAGYSNLKYIADLSPEAVKLDRELITGITRESRLHKLVTAIVRLCSDLGAAVVAEGIETDVELRAVIATGAQYGQGYFLARPAAEPPSVNSYAGFGKASRL